MVQTISELLKRGRDGAIAIAAPERKALDYAGLRAHAQATVAALNAVGIGRGDRVAIVLPNGPEMASAFVAIGAGATTAPLNAGYRADEFEFYLTDLKARALVVEAGMASPAIAVAEKLGVPVMRLVPARDGAAGLFGLESSGASGKAAKSAMAGTAVKGGMAGTAVKGGMAEPGDIALVLHTSGTTSRPKIVPLAQRNVAASARNIATTLALAPEDRCLNIMPLFHIHGLIGAVLSSLWAGASVACTPGFNALKFFAWLDEIKPSWYTAVPTMHQAILGRATRNAEALARAKLRLIRSSSASLPPQVMAELERVFGAPVIESYGMTEASHQMTSNPLPPRARKPGSVGIAAGPEVAILDVDGQVLPRGETGEVAIRGENVTSGYEANPSANESAFTHGWFRTGDQGVLDPEGYLTITGRLKEIINRGGEKISPREVDEILLDHPAVAQAITFAMPHAKLGEEVAAALVLKDGASVTEQEVRAFVSTRLADFKVPRKIVFLAEIPKGATGKLQRIGLARKLGLSD